MDGDGFAIEVRGGAGGMAARLEDMESAAVLLRTAAARLGGAARSLVTVSVSPGLVASGVLSPLTFARAEAAAAVALGGVGPLALRAETIGRSLAHAAAAYAAADRFAAAGLRAVALTGGRAAGFAVVRLAPAPVLLVAGTTVAALAGAAPDETARALNGLGAAAVSLAAIPAGTAGAVLPRLPLPGGAPGTVTEAALAAVPGFVAGLADAVPGAGPLWAAAGGAAWPPTSAADVAALAGALGVATPWFRERSPVQAVAEAPREVRPAASLTDVVRRVPYGDRGPGTPVHVERVTGQEGRTAWVVAVPGTASWDPVPGPVPLDMTGNVHLMAGHRTAGTAAVVAAMDAVGVTPGEPVLLAGHSQGGMVAAAVAADPDVRRRFTVTHVVTAGSPVAGFAVPPDVGVLSLEHDDDVVPQLDAAANPDRARWVTVSADAMPGAPTPGTVAATAGHAHSLAAYARTAAAADASPDPSLAAFRAGLAPFLTGTHAEATTVRTTRTSP